MHRQGSKRGHREIAGFREAEMGRDDDHHGGSGRRISWRIDRLQMLRQLGREIGLTEDANQLLEPVDQQPDRREQSRN